MFLPPRHQPLIKQAILLISAITLILVVYPVEYRSTRCATLVGLLTSLTGALFVFWKSKPVRFILLAVAAAPLMLFSLPGRPANPAALRSRYIRFLRSFDNTRYLWGGESYLGIDCSGLVRKPLILAHLSHGIRTLNGSAIRTACSLWWHDASALALRDGYRDLTVTFSAETSINSANPALLQNGDLAVTADGIHILAYLGQNIWIQADPNLNRVVQITTPSDNPWFNLPVRLIRWRALSNSPPPIANQTGVGM